MRWASDKKRDYISQLNNNADLEEVINELDRLTNKVNMKVSSINNVTNQLAEVLINGAKNCGMVTQIPIINGVTRKNISSGLTRNAYLEKKEFEVARRRWRDNKNGVN